MTMHVPGHALAALALIATCLAAPAAQAQTRAVERVSAVARPPHYDGRCPASIEFIGTIQVNRPITITYRWERSDRATGPVKTLTIHRAGESVIERWELARRPGEVFRGSATLHVLSPGDHYSNPADFTLVCR